MATSNCRQRLVFLGGAPVFDYLIPVTLDEIRRAAGGDVFVVGTRILVPLGTVFQIHADGLAAPVFVNPMAGGELQSLQDRDYCALEFGGKHPEGEALSLSADRKTIAAEMRRAFPQRIRGVRDLTVVAVEQPARVVPGGNNKNIIEEIKALYASPELAAAARGICFEHLFFFDTDNPKFPLVRDLYARLGVSLGPEDAMHVAGLTPRTAFVLNVEDDAGHHLDRIILSNRTNEEVIPGERINQRYGELQYRLRRDDAYVATSLVVNSMTNHEEVRLLVRTLKTAYASGARCYLCPTLTLLNTMERLIQTQYYTTEKERFFSYRKDFIETAIVPFIQYLICNKEELTLLDNAAAKRGIDAAASQLCGRMNRGRQNESLEGGKVVVTGGSKGGRFTERLTPERAKVFWKKAHLPERQRLNFADRRIVCGDDYVTELISTLGAGDVFTGILVGLTVLGWDGGQALRAATLGAQHFIQHRTRPTIADMIAVDEGHVRMGTETELVDVISHHVAASGDPTRYGTIANTVITVSTTQIQHPFREVLNLAIHNHERE
jgi:hypothetical protein